MYLDPMLGLDWGSNVMTGQCIWIPCWACAWIQCQLDDVSGSHVWHVPGSNVGWTMFLDPMLGNGHVPGSKVGQTMVLYTIIGMYCTWIQRWLAMFLDFRVELCIWSPSYGWTKYLDPIFCRGWRSSHLVWDLKAIETCCSEISKIRFFVFQKQAKKNTISSILFFLLFPARG